MLHSWNHSIDRAICRVAAFNAPSRLLMTVVLVIAAGFATPAHAQGKGNGNGGGNGGGDDPPPGPAAIVFSADGVVSTMDADGGGVTALADSSNGHAAAPKWSPDATMISYVGQDGDGNIHIIDADGSNDRVIATNGPYWWDSYGARWNSQPDPLGRFTLGFTTRLEQGGAQDIMLVDEDGATTVNLTETADWSETCMGFSPSGSWMAMVVRPAGGPGDSEMFFIVPFGYDENGLGSIDAGAAINVSQTYETINGAPFPNRLGYIEWSPSGDLVILSVDDYNGSSTSDIYALHLSDLLAGDGSLLIPVAADPTVGESQASWSPDESQIVFRRGDAGKKEPGGLFRINVDGTGLTPLATPKGNKTVSVPHWKRQ